MIKKLLRLDKDNSYCGISKLHEMLDHPISAKGGFAIVIKDVLNDPYGYEPELSIEVLFFVVKELLEYLQETE